MVCACGYHVKALILPRMPADVPCYNYRICSIRNFFLALVNRNPVHPTIGTFSGLGLGLGCGVGWGLGIGMPALGYVGAGCGVGFTVGFTFAGIGVGLPLIWQQTTSITDTEETSLVSAERSGHAIKVKDVLLQLQGASRKVWQSTADSIKGVVAGALPPFRRP
eukprot:jgi/Mesvir1/23076/Mv10001-RA.1